MSTPNKDTRRTIVKMVHDSGAAHLGSALSSVEILSAVFRSVDVDKIKQRALDRDRIILSKGHGVAALYAVMHHYGLIGEEISTYFQNGSLLLGHTSHFVPHVEHSTGALGHGLPVGVGMALGLRSTGLSFPRVFVVVGDGELHEGSNWEAMMLAGHLRLGNLYILVDKNRLSQIGEIDKCCTLEPLATKFESFNFHAIEIQNGHDEDAIYKTLRNTKESDLPVAIICNSVKGKGVSFMENNNLWHYRTPQGEDYEKALAELRE